MVGELHGPFLYPHNDNGENDRMNAHDAVSHPSHYTSSRWPRECIDFSRHMSFLAGNAFKYVWRHADKGAAGVDLRKAVQYLEWAREDNVGALVEVPTVGLPSAPLVTIREDVADCVVYAMDRSQGVPTRTAYLALVWIVLGRYDDALTTIHVALSFLEE